MRIQCSGVLFDLDGVLVNSTPAVERVWAGWAKEHGLDPDDTVRKAHGRPSIATVRELLPNADREEQEEEDAKIEHSEMMDMDGMVALPGAIDLLSVLPDDRWGVVTSGTRPLASKRLHTAGLPVPKHFVTASDIRKGKPDPEPYLIGVENLGFPAKDCVVVEDAPAGVQSARAAGARVLALRTTAEDEELKAAGADWIVDDLSRISVATLNGDGLEISFGPGTSEQADDQSDLAEKARPEAGTSSL